MLQVGNDAGKMPMDFIENGTSASSSTKSLEKGHHGHCWGPRSWVGGPGPSSDRPPSLTQIHHD